MRSRAAFLAALIICAAAVAQENSTRAMTATIVEGSATVQTSPTSATQPLMPGAALQEGNVVQTGADGRVEISTASGDTLRLGSNGRLELSDAPPQGRKFSAHLWLGSLWLKVHKLLQGDSFQVETENGVAGARGTEFMVETGTQGGDDKVRVYEGHVEVHDHLGQWTHILQPGTELAFRSGARPAAPRPFDPASDRAHPLMRWVREHPDSEVKEPSPRREEPTDKERGNHEKREKRRRSPR